ncbi:MAG: hypothetical protein IJT94_12930 [Oscillibacter sp.]|nr:hypothetical protein [Oscillibacter sp.]
MGRKMTPEEAEAIEVKLLREMAARQFGGQRETVCRAVHQKNERRAEGWRARQY